MKRIIWTLTQIIAALCITSCTKEVEDAVGNNDPVIVQETDEEFIRINVRVSDQTQIVTKSMLVSDDIENRITEITLAAYDRDGLLRDVRHYQNDFTDMTLSVVKGNPVDLVALANMGDMRAELPEKEADLSRLSWTIGSYSEVDSSGIPMCGKLEGIDYSTDIQTITLDRLFAKLSIRITHNSLKNTSMTSDINYNMCNQSIYLRQANSRIHPFSTSGSRAGSQNDILEESDYHADLNNRSEYKGHLTQAQLGPGPGFFRDTTIVFYVPENVQGQLLAGNTNPYDKVPENISSVGGRDYSLLCTYLEFKATKTNIGLGYHGDVTYKYYLGSDSTTDFSLVRNCHYHLTLDFTEDGFFVSSWKMSRGENWKDTRTLKFRERTNVIYKGQTKDVMVHYNPLFSSGENSYTRPDEWNHKFDDESMETSGLTYTIDKNTLVTGPNGYKDYCFKFYASENAIVGNTFPLRVESWDGSIYDTAYITIAELGAMTSTWIDCPIYVAQEGILSIGGVPLDKLPVKASGFDSGIVNVQIESDNSLRVTALGAGTTNLVISNCDGSQTMTLNLNIQAPRLVFSGSTPIVNPDGTDISAPFHYADKNGTALSNINGNVMRSKLKVAIRDCPFWLDAEDSESRLRMHVRKLYDESGNLLPVGNTTMFEVYAPNCPDVETVLLPVHVTDPFIGIRLLQEYGRIDDYTMLIGANVHEKVRNYFLENAVENQTGSYEAPVPNAATAQIGAEMVPQGLGKFCNACEAYSIQWKTSDDFSSGAEFLISQKPVNYSMKHSAGKHDLFVTVKNRHSGEKISKKCGTIDIYVHAAIGASADIRYQDGAYKPSSSYPSFAAIYQNLLTTYQLRETHSYIYYMDVSVDFLHPVGGVYVLNAMKTGVEQRQNRFNGLDLIRPSVADGIDADVHLLNSVFDNKAGDRTIVCGEPYGYRRGIGAMIYRAVLLPGRESPLSDTSLKNMMLGYNTNFNNNSLYAPRYNVHDMGASSDLTQNKISKGTPFYFCPTTCTDYTDKSGRGYHVLHFLEEIAPESLGWTNLL